jgi:hypothetical protein
MNASLYICDKSFIHNGSDPDNEVYKRILSLKKLVDNVSKKHGENNTFYFKGDSFLKVQLFSDGTTVEDIVCRNVKKNNDCLFLFNTIFKYFKKCNLDTSGLKEYLSPDLEDENNCNGLIVLNIIPELPRNTQILSDYSSWLNFRRFFLGKYPKSSSNFISESKKYYENLVLHDENNRTLKDVINSHSNQIAKYLGHLNDFLVAELKCENAEKDFAKFLTIFAGTHGLDGASFEGTKHIIYKYEFTNNSGVTVQTYCEPHLKMQKNDADNKRQYCRIYFQKPDIDKGEEIIYIGYIGVHINRRNKN